MSLKVLVLRNRTADKFSTLPYYTPMPLAHDQLSASTTPPPSLVEYLQAKYILNIYKLSPSSCRNRGGWTTSSSSRACTIPAPLTNIPPGACNSRTRRPCGNAKTFYSPPSDSKTAPVLFWMTLSINNYVIVGSLPVFDKLRFGAQENPAWSRDAGLSAAFQEYNEYGLADQSHLYRLAEREQFGIKATCQSMMVLKLFPESFNSPLAKSA